MKFDDDGAASISRTSAKHAIRNGLIQLVDAARLYEQEVMKLIFRAWLQHKPRKSPKFARPRRRQDVVRNRDSIAQGTVTSVRQGQRPTIQPPCFRHPGQFQTLPYVSAADFAVTRSDVVGNQQR